MKCPRVRAVRVGEQRSICSVDNSTPVGYTRIWMDVVHLNLKATFYTTSNN